MFCLSVVILERFLLTPKIVNHHFSLHWFKIVIQNQAACNMVSLHWRLISLLHHHDSGADRDVHNVDRLSKQMLTRLSSDFTWTIVNFDVSWHIIRQPFVKTLKPNRKADQAFPRKSVNCHQSELTGSDMKDLANSWASIKDAQFDLRMREDSNHVPEVSYSQRFGWTEQMVQTPYMTLECKCITGYQAKQYSKHSQSAVSVQQQGLLSGRHVFYIETNVHIYQQRIYLLNAGWNNFPQFTLQNRGKNYLLRSI